MHSMQVPSSGFQAQCEELYLSQREVDEDLDRYLDDNDMRNHVPCGHDESSSKRVNGNSDNNLNSDLNPSPYSHNEFKNNDHYDTYRPNSYEYDINRSEIKEDGYKNDDFIDRYGYKVDKSDQKMDINEGRLSTVEVERTKDEHKPDESDWRAKYDLYTNIFNNDNITRSDYKINDHNYYDGKVDDAHISYTHDMDVGNPDTHDEWLNLTRKSDVSNGKIIFHARKNIQNDDENDHSKDENRNDKDKNKDSDSMNHADSREGSYGAGGKKTIQQNENEEIFKNSELLTRNVLKSIENLRNRLIEYLLIMDTQLDMIKKCLVSCSEIYRTSLSKYSQSLAFDELTARVGEGHMSMTGTDDWRNTDIPGYRYICMQILCTLSLIKKESRKLKTIDRKDIRSAHIGGDKSDYSNSAERLDEVFDQRINDNEALEYDQGLILF